MKLLRKEAVTLISFYRLLNLSAGEMAAYSKNVKSESSLDDDVALEVLHFHIRKYIEHQFKSYSTSYLTAVLSGYLTIPICIIGKPSKLLPCFCCGYKTLDKRGEYDICAVCFWEDDGSKDIEEVSGPNHLTLCQAKENFSEFGVVEKRFQKVVHPDRMLQFEKTI
ncbi:CPCC family cysteine-rich protein [Mucilaginibacter pankratovii]|nr:CPCC family cysteine-rich protein [Mucilaginibacter pankratovii]